MTTHSREPVHAPAPQRATCPDCDWYSFDFEAAYRHVRSVHRNRRVVATAGNAGRREGDGQSPAVRRFMEAAARGEGLGRRRVA